MQQQRMYLTTDVEKLLQDEFMKFTKKWHGVMKGSDLQTLAQFIGQVKEEINKPVTNLA